MTNRHNRRITLLCLFALSVLTMAMGPARQNRKRKSSDERVHLLHADRLYFNQWVNRDAQILVGDVRFEHDGMLMFCDSALFYQETNSFDAFGNVRMRQGDTLSLVGDVLYYDGLEQMARVRHNVVLKHKQTTLYTDSLDYDRMFELGYFINGGRLTDQDNQLTSDWGEYSPATREAVFNYNVRLVNPRPPKNPKSILTSDTLHYNTATGIAHAVGPSNMYNGDSHVYTEDGYYNTKADETYLLNRSQLLNQHRLLVGDSVCWNSKERIGKAFGHAVYTDSLNKAMFLGNYAMYNDSTGYAEAADSAVLIDYSQRDTLYAHADSFFLYTYYINTDSMYRMLHAYHHVRAYRVDLQAVCDSLVYDGRDSCATMYKDPIAWQMGQQLLGEKIVLWSNDSTLDSVYVINQALSVERVDSVHYNQVASNEMHCYFQDGEMKLTIADKNVYLNYYPFDDDSLMIGMNHTESSELRLFLQDRKVERIWMPAATGTIYPLPLIPPDRLYLQNFAWFDYIRPTDKDDIFHWRGKKGGTELKESVQREAPKQRLQNVRK
ncbi:MAG: hypothetical protein HUK02_03305 [Bacteroidaceae bacterium]|nr:hypothetical protein [Bacteroidaceae bacterium]